MDKNQPTTAQLSEKFMIDFIGIRDNISAQIENLSACPTGATDGVIEKLDFLSDEIKKLSKFLHDGTMFLPSYSVKIRQNEIRDLEKALKEKEAILIPKKKFGFKNRQVPQVSTGVNKPVPAPETKPKQEPVPVDTKNFENFVTIEKLSDSTKVFEADELNGCDVLARDLENVTLHLLGSPSTLRLKNVKNSRILCGPVTTSVFVDSVEDSTLFLSCKQLRTHSSNHVDIYLRVLSRAIIEDCENIRFAPYRWNNSKSEELHRIAEIPNDLERFDAVDDFNWLSATQSPHWSILPEAERIEFPDI